MNRRLERVFPRSPPCFPSKHAGKQEEERSCSPAASPPAILFYYLKRTLEMHISESFKLCIFWAPLNLKFLSTFLGFGLDPPPQNPEHLEIGTAIILGGNGRVTPKTGVYIPSKERARSKEQWSHMDHCNTVISPRVPLPHCASRAALAQRERQTRK